MIRHALQPRGAGGFCVRALLNPWIRSVLVHIFHVNE